MNQDACDAKRRVAGERPAAMPQGWGDLSDEVAPYSRSVTPKSSRQQRDRSLCSYQEGADSCRHELGESSSESLK